MGYNGWSNYETWLANLYLEGEWFEEYVRNADKTSAYELGNHIRTVFEDMVYEQLGHEAHGFVTDVLACALQTVDWRELAAHYIEDAK